MSIYKAPLRSTEFALRCAKNDRTGAAGDALRSEGDEDQRAILNEAAKFAEAEFAPLNALGDREGCRWRADGTVTTPTGFTEVYKAFADAGWMGLTAPTAYGGQGLGKALGAAVQEYWVSANMGLAQYAILTNSAIAAIDAAASEAQKKLYLPPLIAGRWSGAMSLTEAHCGTDLGLIRTIARPREHGVYAITGAKIFISAGEHDLAENIIHLVLARMEGAPPGVAGLSLFIVPKFLPDEQGGLGKANRVVCSAIEHKMGIRASATCVLNFEEATGFLVGASHKGLAAMFVMMNETRLTTGVQGVALAEVAYQNAAAYAKTRLQGRRSGGAAQPPGGADPIIVHPDVRRMLMDARAFIEPARLLTIWCGSLVDMAEASINKETRQRTTSLIGLLTPVIKAYLTDKGLEHVLNAQQVFGGHGYIVDTGMEQFVRDARISQIYEGANGIQALDLVARKVAKDGGAAVRDYAAEANKDLLQLREIHGGSDLEEAMSSGLNDLEASVAWLLDRAEDAEALGACAHDFMHLLGNVCLGHMWLKLVIANERALKHQLPDEPYIRGQLTLARYYSQRELSETAFRRRRIEAGREAMMALDAGQF